MSHQYYKDHFIVSFGLYNDRTKFWIPTADISWTGGFSQIASPSESCEAESEAMEFAMKMARRWVDDRRKRTMRADPSRNRRRNVIPSRTILFVEDTAQIREQMTRLLQNEGYTVATADNAETAVKLMQATSFDIVITDLIVQGSCDGIDILNHHYRHSPSKGRVLLTGFPSSRLPTICQYLRALYLPKPYRFEELLFKIKTCLASADISH